MSRSISTVILCAALMPGCAAMHRERNEDRRRNFSPVVALAAFEHCTSELTDDAEEPRLRSAKGDFELAITFDDEGTAVSRFDIVPLEAAPEDARTLARCERFARDYFDYAYSDVGASKWSQPITIRGSFFPIDAAEVTEADGSVRSMALSIERVSRSVTGSSLYRLNYYERNPRTESRRRTPLEIRLEPLLP